MKYLLHLFCKPITDEDWKSALRFFQRLRVNFPIHHWIWKEYWKIIKRFGRNPHNGLYRSLPGFAVTPGISGEGGGGGGSWLQISAIAQKHFESHIWCKVISWGIYVFYLYYWHDSLLWNFNPYIIIIVVQRKPRIRGTNPYKCIHKYCRANQEWQWRNICLHLLSKTLSCTLHLTERESKDRLCINPILRIGLINKWFIDSKSLITL